MPTHSIESTDFPPLPTGIATHGCPSHQNLDGAHRPGSAEPGPSPLEMELEAVMTKLDGLRAAKASWLQAALGEAVQWLNAVAEDWHAVAQACEEALMQQWDCWIAYTDPGNVALANGACLLSDEKMSALNHLHARWHASYTKQEKLAHKFYLINAERERIQAIHDSRSEVADRHFNAQIEPLQTYAMHLFTLLKAEEDDSVFGLPPVMEDGEDEDDEADLMALALEPLMFAGDESAAAIGCATAQSVTIVDCDFTGMVLDEWTSPAASHHLQ